MSIKCPHCAVVIHLTGSVEPGPVEPTSSNGTHANRIGGQQLPATALKLEDHAWLEAAYATRPIRAIAAELCVNDKTVIRWMGRHGIRTRTATEAARLLSDQTRLQREAAAITALQEWADAHGRAPTIREWGMDLGTPGEKTMGKLFGSWGEAVEAAGLEPRQGSAGRIMEERRAAVIATLRQWSAEHGGTPTVGQWNTQRPDGSLSDKGVRNLFGSWGAALDAAGLQAHPLGWQDPDRAQAQREAQRAAFLDGIRAWAAEHDGETPTSTEWQTDRPAGAPGAALVRGMFGTWPDGVKAAGLVPLRPGEKKNVYHATSKGKKPGANRQMVTGNGLQDQRPGTVKHFGRGMRAT